MQDCPTAVDKVVVLKDIIFPICEKLGQTIIFVRTREVASALHTAVCLPDMARMHVYPGWLLEMGLICC